MNLGVVKLITATTGGSTTTFLTTNLFAAADTENGAMLQLTGPTTNDGVTSRVNDSSVTAGPAVTTLTVSPAINTPAAADTAELWSWRCSPLAVHQALNNAIQEATGHFYDPEESVALHGNGRQRRFDLPSEIAMLKRVLYRTSVESKTVHDADSAWDEAAVPTNVTRSVDTEHYKGESANKFVIAGAFTTGLVSSKAISSLDLSGYDYLEFWIESTTATVAGDFTILLDDTAACVSALETLTVPALVADTPTFVRVALANPDTDTAIISVGLNAANNIAANTVWIRKVRAVKENTAVWRELSRRSWDVDGEARDLILTADGCAAIGSRLIKLVGGDKPALFSTVEYIGYAAGDATAAAAADAAVVEVDEQFVIARATELTLRSIGPKENSEIGLRLWDRNLKDWERKAEIAKMGFPMLVGVRVVG